MGEWNQVTLGDLAKKKEIEIRTGPFGSQLHQSDYVSDGIPVVMPKDIIDWNVSTASIAKTSGSMAEKLSIHKLFNGDIVYGRRGDIGRHALVTSREEGWLCGTGCIRLRLKKAPIIPEYLSLFLRQTKTIEGIYNQAVGSTMPNLNTSIIENIEVSYPEAEEQEKVVKALFSYDNLIENNNRRIAILEEMAQRLYREWFVHFRFPGYENVKMVDSELGMIPEGWEIGTVESLVTRSKAGKLYDNKTVLREGRVPVFDQGKSGIIGFHNDAPGVIADFGNPVITFANHTCYQRIIFEPFSAIQNVIPFYPNKDKKRNIYWLHNATKGLIELNDYKGHWPEFMKKALTIPAKSICEEYGKVIYPMEIMKFQLEKKNQVLRKTRDLLLPRLISGDIDVSNIEL